MDHSGKSEEILEAVIRAICAWHTQNITLDDCIAEIRSRHPETARSAASILFEYFRHKSFLDDLVMSSVSRGEIKPELKAAALCALTQALFQDAIARESAVNVAVDPDAIDPRAAVTRTAPKPGFKAVTRPVSLTETYCSEYSEIL